MNILYYSVHQILEDDEVRLFKKLGHNVCCLGVNSAAGPAQNFRDPIVFNEAELALYRALKVTGGSFDFVTQACVLPQSFVDLFDIVIVMHDSGFIMKHWPLFERIPVVWRTIGQGVDGYEDRLRPYRHAGLRILRYSPIETTIDRSLGEDAIIRFCKDQDVYGRWTGEIPQLLTFSNIYQQRYPEDATAYRAITRDLASVLGGGGNETFSNAIGLLDPERQIEAYSRSRAYLYASGLEIPYTLNFIEAWMTGIPVIVHAPTDRRGRYFEIDSLVEDGVTGFICRDVATARRRAQELLADHDLAKRIGSAGREAAIRHFGSDAVGEQWRAFLDQFNKNTLRQVSEPIVATSIAAENVMGQTMKSVSPKVFDALSLLRPFDIDVPKIRIGNERDGGYVLADINLDTDVLSFGVGPDVTFEHEMAERGARVFLHDHTVDGTPQDHRRFTFNKLGICAEGQAGDGLAPLTAHLAKIDGDAENGERSRRFILKMDVEGYEWDVFSTVSQDLLERFDQVVMEIHWLDRLFDAAFEAKVSASLKALNKQFTLFHVHGNNCAELHIVEGFMVASVLELSFVRTSLVHRRLSISIYPSSLDKSNHPDFPDLPLLFYPFLPMGVENYQIKEVITRIDTH